MSYIDRTQILENSWRRIRGKETRLAQRFYELLFQENPHFADMFQINIAPQEEKFFEMINMLINSVRFLDRLAPQLKELGARHVGYGVKPEDYDIVCKTLLRTICELSPTELTSEELEAWRTVALELKCRMLEP